ncbi:MAG: altronate dehydratase [Christensenellaceae bacterium]|nr:altronate dehydratase [Christensenellaceae bacterium]
MAELLRITPRDNVAVALQAIEQGTALTVDGVTVTAAEAIPAGHKIALEDIPADGKVVKYGFPIGCAKTAIAKGGHVHVQNLRTLLSGELEYEYHPTFPKVETKEPATFMGYPRRDGRVGVRNELWILPTVGCVNDIAKALEKEAQSLVGGGVEHVYAFPHPYGCSQMGDDQENTRTVLANLATHPNVGGVLVLGLGCENSSAAIIEEHMGDYDKSRVRFLICQNVEDEFEEAMKLLHELADNMRDEKRVPCPASKLVIGLKCGGSDGFSGITANPVIGGFSDLLVAQGGTTILTEVPEMFGAETILMDRCETEEMFQKTVALINNFKRYFEEHHQTIYENPSPGNKAGGISTLEDKALGCTQKSGFAPVKDVLSYGEKVKTPGLNLLSAPGNDLVAATALASSGAQIVLFSTGRGTPFACPVPTVKIASNTPLATKKSGWIDFNAGQLLTDGKTLPELSQMLMDFVLEAASGKPVCSEARGFHDLAIFKTGVTL